MKQQAEYQGMQRDASLQCNTKCINWNIAVAAAASMVFLFNIAALTGWELGSKGELLLSPFDLLVPVGCLVLLVRAPRKFLGGLKELPSVLLLFVGWCLLSFWPALRSGLPAGGVILFFLKKFLLNVGLFLVAAPLFWKSTTAGPSLRGKLLDSALLAAAVVVIAAWVDFFTTPLQGSASGGKVTELFPFDVGANLFNYNRFGMTMALIVPFATASALLRRDRPAWLRALYGLLAFAATVVILQGAALAGALFGSAVVTALVPRRREKMLGALGIAAALFWIAVVMRPSREAPTTLEYACKSLLPIKEHPRNMNVFGQPEYVSSERTRRLARVALAVSRRPVLGSGLGGYGREIIKNTEAYPPAMAKGAAQTDDRRWWDIETNEKNGFGGYEVMAVETGVVGMFLFAATLVLLAFRAASSAASSPAVERWSHVAAAGALLSAATAALFLDPLMRGAGGWLSLAVAFAAFPAGGGNRPSASSSSQACAARATPTA